MTRLTREQSERRSKLLRAFSDRQFTLTDLLQIFGEAFKSKFREAPTRHQMLGKHYLGKDHEGLRRPQQRAGTKLMKRWIGKERVNKALHRRRELVTEILKLERSEPGTGKMAHGRDSSGRGALLRIDRHGDVVAQYDDLASHKAYGWHQVPLLQDFKLDNTLAAVVRNVVRA